MSLCDNFDQHLVHSSRPTKGHPILYRPIYKKKKNVNPFPIPCFHDPEINYTEKEVGKEEIACNNEFFFKTMYCETRIFRRVLIFVDFVGNAIHEIKFTTNVRSGCLICD